MPLSIASSEKVVQQIRAEIARSSLAAVSLRLGINRHSLASFLIGSARPGTVALIERAIAAVKP